MSAWGWSLRDLPWGSCNARIFSPKMSLKKQPGLSLARLHWQVDISDDNEVTEYMCEQFSTKTLFHQWPSCSVLHQLRHWIFTLTGPCRSLVLKAPIWYRHISAIAISWGLKHTKPPCLILKPTFFENSIAMTAHEASALNPRPHGGRWCQAHSLSSATYHLKCDPHRNFPLGFDQKLCAVLVEVNYGKKDWCFLSRLNCGAGVMQTTEALHLRSYIQSELQRPTSAKQASLLSFCHHRLN